MNLTPPQIYLFFIGQAEVEDDDGGLKSPVDALYPPPLRREFPDTGSTSIRSPAPHHALLCKHVTDDYLNVLSLSLKRL